MKNIIKENKQFLLAFFGGLLIILSCSVFVSNSNTEVQELVIKSMTPLYDEESTVLVDNLNVTFNDKNQVVKYSVLVENTRDYDVKVSDLQFGTQSEEFLKYTVENIELDDVIPAGETKELVISFETVKMDGWGRNFNDEIVTTLVFDKIKKNEEVVTPPVEDTNKNENVPANKVENNNSVNNVQPEVNVPTNQNPSVEEPKEDVNNDVVTTPEDNANHEIKVEPEVIVEKNNVGETIAIYSFGIATGFLGAGLVMVNKNKFTKYIVVFILVGTTIKIGYADEVIDLSIPINVSYESQNVMEKAVIMGYDDWFALDYVEEYFDYWNYHYHIKNFYIENEISEITNYVHKFDVSEEKNGRVVAYLIESENNDVVCYDDSNQYEVECYDLYLQADGIIYPNTDAKYYFGEMKNLDRIYNIEGFDTSNVTDMSFMFYMTGYSSSVFTLDLGNNFDTSKVTSMKEMFSSTGNRSPVFTLDLGDNFDTSNVTDMSYMFSGIGVQSKVFALDLKDKFDTSKVTNMGCMFYNIGWNSTVFTLNLGDKFDTSNVTSMFYMFNDVGYKTPQFALNLGDKFDTSNVTNMDHMFSGVGYYSNEVTLDLGDKFDTTKVETMTSMFWKTGYSSTTFTLNLGDKFDTKNVTDMMDMFNSTGYNSTKLNISFTVSNPDPTRYINMFKNVATKGNSKITVNYTAETKDLVDLMIATKSSNSNVVKGKLIVEVDKFDVGDEVYIEDEWFNVISQDDDTITLLTKYNLGIDYRQSTSENYVLFANNTGWEYSTGKNEIDISSWSSVVNTYINEYVDYISDELSDDSVTGDLMTLNQLSSLGCVVPTNYEYVEDSNGRTCSGSNHIGWINNNQRWWTKSAVFEYSEYVWIVGIDNHLGVGLYNYTRGIRPVIRVSKDVLKNYYDNKNVR